jgi:flagellar FliL protein
MSAKPAPAADAPAKKGLPLIPIIIAAVVAAGAAGGGAMFFMKGDAPHAEGEAAEGAEAAAPAAAPLAQAQYIELAPAFVVNLADPGPARYLQVDVQLVARKSTAAAAVEAQKPALRNALLMLFSQQTQAQVMDRAGKEALQAAALAEVQRVLETETGDPQIDALLFTSFVTQ